MIHSKFHPLTDGQSKRTIQTLEVMLQACVLDLGGRWGDHLPLMEFAYNNSFHFSIGTTPFETLYKRKCRSPIYQDEVDERKLLRPELVQITTDKIKLIKEYLRAVQSRHKSYDDQCIWGLEFHIGDHLFLKISSWKSVF